MTKEELKLQIDTNITNKTLANSITPLNVGNNMKAVVDLIPIVDGSETKLTPGNNIVITGDGTISFPYVINNVTVDSRPYKVYTAILTQTSTNNPTATVLENTLGGTITWVRYLDGRYRADLSYAGYILNKTIGFATPGGISLAASNQTIKVFVGSNASELIVYTIENGVLTDGILHKVPIEIRVYN